MTPPDYTRRTLRNESASNVVETLTVRHDVTLDIAFRGCLNREEPWITMKRNVKQFAAYAQYGRLWYLALDSTDTALTTITNAPVEGSTVISLLNSSAVVAGRSYVVRNDVDVEVVKVASIAVPDVTLTEPLNFAFFPGDRFRSELYWPARLVDDSPIIVERGPLWYDVEIRFIEDVNSL